LIDDESLLLESFSFHAGFDEFGLVHSLDHGIAKSISNGLAPGFGVIIRPDPDRRRLCLIFAISQRLVDLRTRRIILELSSLTQPTSASETARTEKNLRKVIIHLP
jgi:hypothetical protein